MATPAGQLNEWIVVEEDDRTGLRGPRGTRDPVWVPFAEGWASVRFGSASDPIGLGGQDEPERTVTIRFRPNINRDDIVPGMNVRWNERVWKITSVRPVLRTYTNRWSLSHDVDLIAVDRKASVF